MSRQSYYPTISPEPSPNEIALHLRNLYTAANDHDQAIIAVNGKVGGVTTTITKVENVSSGGGGGGSPSPPPTIPSLGAVNNQQGVTSYTTQQSDNGAKVIVGDASPVAVTLNHGVTTPWFTTIDNDGTAVANLTASSGSLFGEQSIQPGGFGVIYFDGTNFWCGATGVAPQNKPVVAHQFFTAFSSTTGAFTAAQPAYGDISGTPVLPANTAAVAHQWVSAYNSTTGAFTQSQPAYTDLTGLPTLPATATPVAHQFVTGYNSGAGTFSQAQPAFSDISGQITTSQLPASGLSVTITTAKLTTGGANGSMTFTNGILTAQTPAT